MRRRQNISKCELSESNLKDPLEGNTIVHRYKWVYQLAGCFIFSLLFKWTTGWLVLINARWFILSLFILCLKHAIPLFSLYSGIMVFGAAALLWRVCLNKVMGGDLIIILSGSQSKEIKSNRLVNDQRSLQIVSGQRRAPSVAIWLSIIFCVAYASKWQTDLCEIHIFDRQWKRPQVRFNFFTSACYEKANS